MALPSCQASVRSECIPCLRYHECGWCGVDAATAKATCQIASSDGAVPALCTDQWTQTNCGMHCHPAAPRQSLTASLDLDRVSEGGPDQFPTSALVLIVVVGVLVLGISAALIRRQYMRRKGEVFRCAAICCHSKFDASERVVRLPAGESATVNDAAAAPPSAVAAAAAERAVPPALASPIKQQRRRRRRNQNRSIPRMNGSDALRPPHSPGAVAIEMSPPSPVAAGAAASGGGGEADGGSDDEADDVRLSPAPIPASPAAVAAGAGAVLPSARSVNANAPVPTARVGTGRVAGAGAGRECARCQLVNEVASVRCVRCGNSLAAGDGLLTDRSEA